MRKLIEWFKAWRRGETKIPNAERGRVYVRRKAKIEIKVTRKEK